MPSRPSAKSERASELPDVAPAPELSALVQAVAAHADPWFAALGRSFLLPRPARTGTETALVDRLEQAAAHGEYEQPDVASDDQQAPGPHGPVPVRVYRADADARPVLVWCHGGGFISGDLDMPEADATARELAVRAGITVVSVDYRRAINGVHFPVPHDDVLAAYEWAVQQFGVAAIGGASAGANLAAGVALRLRDESRRPAGVVLAYPLVHPELPAPSPELARTMAVLPDTHAFRGPSFTPMVENYLGARASQASPYAMPGLADLEGYPPTLIVNCEYDGLRASGEAFAAALEDAGAEVVQHMARGVLHGHLNSPWLPQAQQSYADIADWLTAHRARS